MKQLHLFAFFLATLITVATPNAIYAQVVTLGTSSVGASKVDTIPAPPQVVTTFPSSVSDEVLFGNDTLGTRVNDIDISFGSSGSASAKTPDEGEPQSIFLQAEILTELRALRKEIAELKAEVNGLRRKKKRRRKG